MSANTGAFVVENIHIDLVVEIHYTYTKCKKRGTWETPFFGYWDGDVDKREIAIATAVPPQALGGGANGVLVTDAKDREALLLAVKEALTEAIKNFKKENLVPKVKDIIVSDAQEKHKVNITEWETEPVKDR